MLKNKLNINSEIELEIAEEKISKRKAIQLYEHLDELEVGTFSSLKYIHQYLFEEIYDFAGKVRSVNLSKNGFYFAPSMYLNTTLENIDQMPQSNFDQIIDKYIEMNLAHPFREGNGRSMRIWLDCILKKEISRIIDWSTVDKEAYLLAMKNSPIKDNEIKQLLKSSLSNKINDFDMYMRGIDQSFSFERLKRFHTKELHEEMNEQDHVH